MEFRTPGTGCTVSTVVRLYWRTVFVNFLILQTPSTLPTNSEISQQSSGLDLFG